MLDSFQNWELWSIAGISLITLEALVPGFVLAGIGISCLLSALASYLGMGTEVQGLILLSGSGLFFISIRPIALKFLYPSTPETKTNAAALLGKMAIVTERIDPDTQKGRVCAEGSYWIGVSADQTIINEKEITEIVSVTGATLTVKRKEAST